MKRYFVIDVDSEFSSVRVLEVTQDFEHGTVNYHRGASDSSLINAEPSPKFYGQLDALLVTSEKLAKAEPITPELAVQS
jgi:hypothetical protein